MLPAPGEFVANVPLARSAMVGISNPDHLPRKEEDHVMGDDRADSLEAWGLLTSDDNLHLPRTSDDSWWTETVWFSWMVPERKMLGDFRSGVQGDPRRHVRKRVSDRCGPRISRGDTVLRGILALPKLPDRPRSSRRINGKRDGAEVSRTWPDLRVPFRQRSLEIDLRYEALMKPPGDEGRAAVQSWMPYRSTCRVTEIDAHREAK